MFYFGMIEMWVPYSTFCISLFCRQLRNICFKTFFSSPSALLFIIFKLHFKLCYVWYIFGSFILLGVFIFLWLSFQIFCFYCFVFFEAYLSALCLLYFFYCVRYIHSLFIADFFKKHYIILVIGHSEFRLIIFIFTIFIYIWPFALQFLFYRVFLYTFILQTYLIFRNFSFYYSTNMG